MLFRLQSLLFRSGFVQNTDLVFIFLLNLGFFSHLTLDFFKIFFLTNLWYFLVLANRVCLCLILQVVSYGCLNLCVLEFRCPFFFLLLLLLCSSIKLTNNWLRSNDSKVHLDVFGFWIFWVLFLSILPQDKARSQFIWFFVFISFFPFISFS